MMNIASKELSEDEFKKLQGFYQAQFGITMNKQVLLLFETQKTAHLQELELIQNLYQQQKEENAALYQEQIEVLNLKINQDKEQHEKYTDAIEKVVVAIGKQKGAIIGNSLKFGANFLYYWTYSSFPWSAFLKISLSTPINILKDQTFALTIESPCLKYEIANREGLFL